jgi:anti-sigma B factor antagonist
MMPVRVTEFVVDEPHKMQPLEHQLDLLAEQAGQGTLRLDFRWVEYLTSMVLAKLVSLHKRTKSAGGSLQIINVNAEVYELFELTRLNTILDVRAKPDSADGGSLVAKSA